MNESSIARLVTITGRVQGVFFRAWTKEQADALGVRGWVRNRADGSVEAHVEGKAAGVAELIDRLRRGPPVASVHEVQISEAIVASAQDFAVKH